MNKTLIATLATLLWLLLPVSLPAALAQDEKLGLSPVQNFDFTADNALAWDAPTDVAQEHILGFKLYVKYLIKGSGDNYHAYSLSQQPSASATGATLSYDTSKGSFHCAVASINIFASPTLYKSANWIHATRGPCTDFNWKKYVDSGQDASTVLSNPFLRGNSPASRARPSVRDGVMLAFDGRLNPHAAAPVAAYAGAGNLNFWHVLANSEGISIGSIPDVNALVQAGHAGGELLRATHPESGKTVTVTYRSQFRMLEVSTFYADTEHQANKLYTFCIMPDNHVEIVLW